MTPFLSGTLNLVEDPQFGLRSAVFFSEANECHVGCKVCKYRDGRKHAFLELDKFLQELSRYEVIGAEMVSFRGGELTNHVSDVQTLLESLDIELPIRIHTNGLRTSSIQRLMPAVAGFCVDVKLPLKDSYSQGEREMYQTLVGAVKCAYSYRDSLRATIDLVDGMGFTYFTSSTFPWLSEEVRQEIKESLLGRKAPFILHEYQGSSGKEADGSLCSSG